MRRFVLRKVVVEGLGPVPHRATRASHLRDGVLKVLVARRISEAVRRPDGVEPSVIQHAEPDDG